MTRDLDRLDRSEAMPNQGDRIAAALASVDQALSALRQPGGRLPAPPARVTAADRLVL
jgi:hypothetical protein